MTRPAQANPWDELRRRRGGEEAPNDPKRGARRRDASAEFLPPGGSERLWTATAGVLSAVQALLEVAEDICQEKGRGTAGRSTARRRTTPPGAGPPDGGFRRVAFVDDDREEANQ